MTPALLPHQQLRAATQVSHEAVDGAFGRYDLSDRADYVAFLMAHARALPPVEMALADVEFLPDFTPRTPLLAADLAELGHSLPAPLALDRPRSSAEAWAMFYVVEGSRLGGVMLARSVAADLPHAYLSAGHGRGGWRAILAGFDAAARDKDWMQEAVAAARATFTLYGRAVAADPAGDEGNARGS